MRNEQKHFNKTDILASAEPEQEPVDALSDTAVCTICSRNYLARAITLMQSVARHHPLFKRILLLTDEEDGTTSDEAFTEVVRLEQITLPQVQKFKFRYEILEFNTACKPWLLNWLLQSRGLRKVIYLDPDICLYSPIREAERVLDARANIVLTPHLTSIIDDDRHPGERDILRAGTWNLGFIGLRASRTSRLFLQWWCARLEYHCVHAVDEGLFVDQKWIDLVPGLFGGVRYLRHPGYNLAYWNIAQRRVQMTGEQWLVEQRPLRFAHFSGIDIENPKQISIHQNRFSLADLEPAAQQLFHEYRRRVLDNGEASCRTIPYGHSTFSNGEPIPAIVRKIYRESPCFQERAGDDPFRHGATVLNEAVSTGPVQPLPMTRLLDYLLRTESGLRSKFSAADTSSRRAFCECFIDHLSEHYRFSDFFIDPLRRLLENRSADSNGDGKNQDAGTSQSRKREASAGLNIIGYFRHSTGVGQSARQCYFTSRHQREYAYTPIDYSVSCHSGSNDDSVDPYLRHHNPHAVNVFHVNADQMPTARRYFGDDFFLDRYNIGFWHWELPEFPDCYSDGFAHLDEIWAPTRFVQQAIQRRTRLPVVVMPHGIGFSVSTDNARARFGIPGDSFVFLTMYDGHSYRQRKNPEAVIRAFTLAFPEEKNVLLVVKRMNAGVGAQAKSELEQMLEEDARCLVIDETLDRQAVNDLHDLADCYVSLHRSEGFGLGLAESMFLGKPVIATNWSGNVDFTRPENSCLVDYQLAPLGETVGPYRQGSQWAEVDIDHAAHYMKRLYRDSEYRRRIARAGKRTIGNEYSYRAVAQRYITRLSKLPVGARR